MNGKLKKIFLKHVFVPGMEWLFLPMAIFYHAVLINKKNMLMET